MNKLGKLMSKIGAVKDSKIRLLHPANWVVMPPALIVILIVYLGKVTKQIFSDIWELRKEFTIW